MQKKNKISVFKPIRDQNLILRENSCRFYKTQMHATRECRRRNILKVDKSTQFPPPLPLPDVLKYKIINFSRKLYEY